MGKTLPKFQSRFQSYNLRDFPGGPVVKTLHFNAGGMASIPGEGTKIPHAMWPQGGKNHDLRGNENRKIF